MAIQIVRYLAAFGYAMAASLMKPSLIIRTHTECMQLMNRSTAQRRGQETGSGNDFRIWKYGQWDPFIHARDLGGLGIMDPGLGGKDGAITGRGFEASGNTDSSGIGPERALEVIIPAPLA